MRRRYVPDQTCEDADIAEHPRESGVAAPGRACPRCARDRGIPIEYGLPDDGLIAHTERGEVVIGGCIVDDGAPDFHCVGCGHEWVDGSRPPW
jgi:hypothetical protein